MIIMLISFIAANPNVGVNMVQTIIILVCDVTTVHCTFGFTARACIPFCGASLETRRTQRINPNLNGSGFKPAVVQWDENRIFLT